MPLSNYERMILLAEEIFDVKKDPDQLDVNPEVLERLHTLHPATVSEYNEGNGPLAWVILIPTTRQLMTRFLENKISEKELFQLTMPAMGYNALYLCSAMVLEEFRRKGITKQLVLKAINNIKKNHPLTALFVWSFTKEGDLCAEEIARLTSLPLYKRNEKEEKL